MASRWGPRGPAKMSILFYIRGLKDVLSWVIGTASFECSLRSSCVAQGWFLLTPLTC